MKIGLNIVEGASCFNFVLFYKSANGDFFELLIYRFVKRTLSKKVRIPVLYYKSMKYKKSGVEGGNLLYFYSLKMNPVNMLGCFLCFPRRPDLCHSNGGIPKCTTF